MAKKMFLNREKDKPPADTTSVSRADIPYTSRDIPVSEQISFLILYQTSKSFPKFNATGHSLLIKFNSPGEEKTPATYLKVCITAFRNNIKDDVPRRDLVGLRIRNTENLQDKMVGTSLRYRDQIKRDVVWGVIAKMIQSNARFAQSDRLEVYLEHVRMPAGNGRAKAKGVHWT